MTKLSTQRRRGAKTQGQIPTYDELRIALGESLRLQAHYAHLLNMYDAGKRMQFPTIDLWLARLRETGTLKLATVTVALPGK